MPSFYFLSYEVNYITFLLRNNGKYSQILPDNLKNLTCLRSKKCYDKCDICLTVRRTYEI